MVGRPVPLAPFFGEKPVRYYITLHYISTDQVDITTIKLLLLLLDFPSAQADLSACPPAHPPALARPPQPASSAHFRPQHACLRRMGHLVRAADLASGSCIVHVGAHVRRGDGERDPGLE